MSPWLLEKVQNGEAILFLGAGASMGATGPEGQKPVSGEGLRNILADKFLGGKRKDKALVEVAEYSKHESSLLIVQNEIKKIFEPLEPAYFHEVIPKFRWHAIITTNYDLVLEKAYEKCKKKLQSLAPIIRDADNFSEKISNPHTVPYLKLHGCITTINDEHLPLILASEEYARHMDNRKRLFSYLKEWGREHPIIFCGYEIADPNIQHILFDLGDMTINRPKFALVKPNLDEFDERYWNARRFDTISTTFENFVNYLDCNISIQNRILSSLINQDSITIKPWIASHVSPSSELVDYMTYELEHVVKGMPVKGVVPLEFYRGMEKSWGIFSDKLDIKRRIVDDVLLKCILDESNTKLVQCYALKGHAGSGKTICLMRIAWDAVNDHDKLIFFLKNGGIIRKGLLQELYHLVNQRIILFVDNALKCSSDIIALINFSEKEKIPLTIIFSARTNEWNVYGDELASKLNDEFDIRDLSEKEIKELLTKLEVHKALGHLEQISQPQRLKAFRLSSDRQLLVALHEATSGKPFEEIIFDEYQKLVPIEAQILYLDICTLHRFQVPVRAGLISRISEINFEKFKEKLHKPLEHVVRISFSAFSNDYVYTSRHYMIAEIVFQNALRTQNERADQIIRMLKFLNVDYRNDEEAFNQIIKGKTLAELFSDRAYVDQIFTIAIETGASRGFIEHQKAVFELSHPGGSTRRAMDALTEAGKTTSYASSSLMHTKASVLRKMATEALSDSERDRYRADAKVILEKQLKTAVHSHPFHTLGQILIDEIKEKLRYLINNNQDDADKFSGRVLTTLISKTEETIYNGLQKFPNDEYLLTLQSDLAQILQDEPKAIVALETAFRTNPRSGFVASRLARYYKDINEVGKAIIVLEKCLEQNPTSKEVHLELAMIYIEQDEQNNTQSIIHHLRRSFTEGDVNYDAQFWFARHQFIYGDKEASKRIFMTLNKARLSPKMRNLPRALIKDSSGNDVFYEGSVKSLNDNYCFVECIPLRSDIYAFYNQFEQDDWDHLDNYSILRFNIGFTMRGPVVVCAKLT